MAFEPTRRPVRHSNWQQRRGLKSRCPRRACGFESHPPHRPDEVEGRIRAGLELHRKGMGASSISRLVSGRPEEHRQRMAGGGGDSRQRWTRGKRLRSVPLADSNTLRISARDLPRRWTPRRGCGAASSPYGFTSTLSTRCSSRRCVRGDFDQSVGSGDDLRGVPDVRMKIVAGYSKAMAPVSSPARYGTQTPPPDHPGDMAEEASAIASPIASCGACSTQTVAASSTSSATRRRTYRYPRYEFSNRSDDIRAIFCKYCDCLGIEWRRMNRWSIPWLVATLSQS